MLNIVIFGPPGAGKGTQSAKLIDHYKLIHLSTGDIFRANIKGGTDLGKLAKSFMDKGDLVPDAVTIQMLETEFKKHQNPKGFIFDGFPRTEAQATALDQMLAQNQTSISLMLSLEANREELIKRLLLRGKDSGRADDSDEKVIGNRLQEYEQKTAPLVKFYQNQGKYFPIQGIGRVEDIFNLLVNTINQAQGIMG